MLPFPKMNPFLALTIRTSLCFILESGDSHASSATNWSKVPLLNLVVDSVITSSP